MIRHVMGPLLFLGLCLGTAWAATPGKKPATTKASAGKAADTEEVGVIETNMGTIVLRFYEKDAPQTVANFKKLASSKFYDGTTFHRVIPGFVIQGGDPNSKDSDRSNDGLGGPGYTVPAEIKQLNKRGAVATARLPDQVNPKRESSGSQFYVCLSDLPSLDKGGYTVFAQVIDGMDVADKISQVKRDERDNPVEPVVMKKVTIEKRPLAKAGGEGASGSTGTTGKSGSSTTTSGK